MISHALLRCIPHTGVFLVRSIGSSQGHKRKSVTSSPVPLQRPRAQQSGMSESLISLSVCFAEKGTGGTRGTNILKTFQKHSSVQALLQDRNHSQRTCTARIRPRTFPGGGLNRLPICTMHICHIHPNAKRIRGRGAFFPPRLSFSF